MQDDHKRVVFIGTGWIGYLWGNWLGVDTYFIFIGNILVSLLTTLIDGSKSLFYQNEMLNAFIFLHSSCS